MSSFPKQDDLCSQCYDFIFKDFIFSKELCGHSSWCLQGIASKQVAPQVLPLYQIVWKPKSLLQL